MTKKLLAAIGVLVLAAGAAGAYAFWPRGAKEVSKQEAVEDFRDRQGTTATNPEASEPSEPSGPAAGVYEFEATGTESVKLGPLPAEERTLGPKVTASVVTGEKGCFTWTLNLFKEHTEDTDFCPSGTGLKLVTHIKNQTFGALTPKLVMTCDPGLLPGPGEPDKDIACELKLEGGPVPVSTAVKGTASTAQAKSFEVDGQSVEATPVTVSFTVSGDISGTWVETTWWFDSNLPIHLERDLDLKGPATLFESSELQLLSLQPGT